MIKYVQTNKKGRPVEFGGPTIDRVVENCLKWRKANPKNGTPDYDVILAQVTAQLQAKNALLPAQEESNKSATRRQTWNIEALMHGARALYKNLKGHVVPNAEIERRAKICKDCPQFTLANDCRACQWASKLAKKKNDAMRAFGKGFVIPRYAGVDMASGGCSVCGCAMLLVLPARIEEFQDEDARIQKARPVHCWAKQGGPNFAAPA